MREEVTRRNGEGKKPIGFITVVGSGIVGKSRSNKTTINEKAVRKTRETSSVLQENIPGPSPRGEKFRTRRIQPLSIPIREREARKKTG